MDLPKNEKLKNTAKMLRKNMTRHEKHLWYDFLSHHNLKWQRQRIIGDYIVDFYCEKAKLVVELDGNQHYEEKGFEQDYKRTEVLELLGLRIIRIPNFEIDKNFADICDYINEIAIERINQIRK